MTILDSRLHGNDMFGMINNDYLELLIYDNDKSFLIYNT